jgi:glycosyltransferase involved in cell wall biosynthesis
MNKPLFSIIIPTRERHQTLPYAMQSVLNQTYNNFELIIMDNFSSNKTYQAVSEFNDKRIRYFRSPKRLSMSDNWDLALSQVTGDYVFILGDDDGLIPDGIENGLKLLQDYQVGMVSWFRSQYWWPKVPVVYNENRLFLHPQQLAYIWSGKEIVKQFYNQTAMFEHLPMIYNSFIDRHIIEKIKAFHNGRYFFTHCPDIFSGIVNAYFGEIYLYSFRGLSLAGLSKYSGGTTTGYQSINQKPLEDFIQDEKLDVTKEDIHPLLIPSKNQEISVANVQLKTKQLFFPEDREIQLNIKNLLQLVASRINRDPDSYDIVYKDIQLLAGKHNILLDEIKIPEKLSGEIKPYQGLSFTSNQLSLLVFNCEQIGIFNVADAAKLAQGILPSIENLRVENHLATIQSVNIPEPKSPIILIDGVFFQLYKTGIARVWRSLLEQWANTDFAKQILVINRANTAPKIAGIRYRTIPPYDYNNRESDRQMLQQICDEEEAELFISTYYTTPINTPSVFMAYDMIPEVVGANLNEPMWQEKHKAINHASGYIAISGNTARDLAGFFPDIPLESITVAHCGVNSLFSPADEREINAFKYKYGINKPYFLLGALGGYKNSILFFQAFAQLANKQSFEIVATGAGSQLPPEWRQYTAGCTFHGLQLTDEELRLAYAGAAALVYPSKYEGFGMPIIEAMACGCPVITTPNASIPEVAGEAALYVQDDDIEGMANALWEVQKPSVRRNVIQAGLQQAQKFSWATMAEIVKGALLNAILPPLRLTEINYLIFPDWQTDEEELALELSAVIRQLANSSDNQLITLLIDTTGITEEDANLFLSGIAMNLMLEEELDLAETLDFSLISNLSQQQWQDLLPKVTAKITLVNENQEAVIQAQAEEIVTLNGSGNNYVIFPDWAADEEELSAAISEVLKQISLHPQAENITLSVDISNAESEEEAGLFFSGVAMNLMLEEEIELPETTKINFVENFTLNQWQSLASLMKAKISLSCESLPDALENLVSYTILS